MFLKTKQLQRRKYPGTAFSLGSYLCFFGLWLALMNSAFAGEKILTAVYSAEYSGMDIEITRSLEFLGDGNYSYNFDADSALARVKENSRFMVKKAEFLPLSYSYERKVFGFGNKETIDFHWDDNKAIYSKGRKTIYTHVLETGILDSSLYQLQLQKDLFHQQEQLIYRYIQRDKIKERSFRITGETTFSVGEKTYPALTLKRVSNDEHISTEIIVIPELLYLIAQIEQEKDGSTIQTSLKQVNLNPEKLAKLYQTQ